MSPLRRIRIGAWLLLALLSACQESPAPYHGTVIQGVDWGGDFTLTSQRGTAYNTALLHGRLQVLFFGFSHCPDICTPTLAKLAQVNKALGEDRKAVQVLFITIDPEHDTPGQLARFLKNFDESFIGLTGTGKEVDAVTRMHKIYAAGSGGGITHSGNLLVKDRQGQVRLVIPESASTEDIVDDLRRLLNS